MILFLCSQHSNLPMAYFSYEKTITNYALCLTLYSFKISAFNGTIKNM